MKRLYPVLKALIEFASSFVQGWKALSLAKRYPFVVNHQSNRMKIQVPPVLQTVQMMSWMIYKYSLFVVGMILMAQDYFGLY